KEIYTTPFSTLISTSLNSSRLKDRVRLLVRTILSESLLFFVFTRCCIYLFDALISSTSFEIFTLPWVFWLMLLSSVLCNAARALFNEALLAFSCASCSSRLFTRLWLEARSTWALWYLLFRLLEPVCRAVNCLVPTRPVSSRPPNQTAAGAIKKRLAIQLNFYR